MATTMTRVLPRWTSLVCIAALCGRLCAAEDGTEQVKSLSASQVLGSAASSKNYRVVDPVKPVQLLYSFSMWTPFGWWEPQSLAMLQIKINEANALAALNGMSDDPLFFEGVGEAAENAVSKTGQALRTPVRSIAQVPMGLAKFGNAVQARANEGPVQGETGGVLVQRQKRQLAAQLGVDPYTDNQQLQSALNHIASHKNAGALTARIATAFVGGGVGAAIKVVKLNARVQQRLIENTGPELQRQNRKDLMALSLSAQAADAFLRQPGYTVTRTTAITDALTQLRSVRGIARYTTAVRPGYAPEVPLFHQIQLEMAAGYNKSKSRLSSLQFVSATPAFTDAMGNLNVFAPVDLLSWSDEVKARAGKLASSGDSKVHIWITGTATDAAKEQLEKLNITVHENAGNELLENW